MNKNQKNKFSLILVFQSPSFLIKTPTKILLFLAPLLFTVSLTASNLILPFKIRQKTAACLAAIQQDNPPLLRSLLDQGASIDSQQFSSDNGIKRQTLLMLALQRKKVSSAVIKTLMEANANVNLPDETGVTALSLKMKPHIRAIINHYLSQRKNTAAQEF